MWSFSCIKQNKTFPWYPFQRILFLTTCYDPGWPEVDDIPSTRKFVSGSLGSAWSLRVSFRGPGEKIVNVRLPSVTRWIWKNLSFWPLEHFLLGLALFLSQKGAKEEEARRRERSTYSRLSNTMKLSYLRVQIKLHTLLMLAYLSIAVPNGWVEDKIWRSQSIDKSYSLVF